MISRRKISLIGSGNIGGILAYLINQKKLGDIVMLDINEGLSRGKSLDISESSAVNGFCFDILGTSDYQEIRDSDAIIVTAGIARKPGMSRDDLLNINARIIEDIAKQIQKYSPNAFVIIITNPLDAMVWHLYKKSNLPSNMVVGMAGVLDSARFSYFIAQHLNISVENVSSLVLGSHGDLMLPLIRYSTVGGIPITDLIKLNIITQSDVDDIIQRTRKGGEEIVKLLQNGSAYYAPATSAIYMLESYLYDKKRILSCAAYLNGEYGVYDLFVGVPVIIGKNGIEKVIELDLLQSEKETFNNSIKLIKNLLQLLN
ncbi:malate dehydrogenase [Candidatus Neoehrlichia procyonis]|uniref:Malate dehydrogenase n=1 Tax=Candidatus Neoehrlichia procyonis str. RAC413 TaxID=1359163 RepID=A0A0F3NPM3_9RICK|nr:malate dehydrogenase [Candidatus Neoehrlichia lotoris]KJV68864.1 malate dehydrogenase, NAD-dependent [Candidatus Neoehrlichia lotoris str. RAC413]